MKKKYEPIEIDIIKFGTELDEVLRASDVIKNDIDLPWDNRWDNFFN